ncbi:MAG TPA: DUF1501 domain-containing protein, partial [Pirellulaceae bacterium]|nr:DUF1501 domain-containing protein [Pirellulaceae bacterium]
FLQGGLLGGVAVGLGGIAATTGIAEQMKSKQKRILNIFLHGGVSQLETWDPKPNTDTGGPFRAIPTSVPGMHISELLPHTAQQMHRLALVRSLNTKNGDHGRGQVEMTTGHKQMPGVEYPHLGAAAAKALTPEQFPLPGHILIRGAGSGNGQAAYLGPKYASVVLSDGKPPENSARPANVSGDMSARRNELRRKTNDRFSGRRRTADTDAYTFSYDQAQQLMTRTEVFDVTKESASDHERYGKHEFGQHCLLARRLLEADVPFVQINHSNYDTHFENFDYHIEQLGEFDKPFATLIGDLAERGLLENTVVCVMSEFGRTPKINKTYGRDHWGNAWSVLLGGSRIQPGAIIGKTNDNGTAVVDREVDHGHVFHTILQAAGVNSKSDFQIGGRNFPIADPAKDAIKELLT